MIQIKENITEYTESEFRSLIKEILDISGSEEYQNDLVYNFDIVTEHPSGSDLIFYPEPGQAVNPEAILETVKNWRAENGLPGFKPE